MYAIIQDGARQFQVEPGQQLDIDYRDLSAGDEVKFDRVLAFRDDEGLKLGRPTLESATVTAKVVSAVRGPKLVVQKFRRRRTSVAAPATGKSTPEWSSTKSSSADARSKIAPDSNLTLGIRQLARYSRAAASRQSSASLGRLGRVSLGRRLKMKARLGLRKKFRKTSVAQP